jgi:cephalosporin hydroxylase
MPGNYLTKPQQHLDELREFVEFIRANNVKSYCEIGCKHGGLLWAVAQAMPRGSRVVGVDLPNGPHGRTDSEQSLKDCFRELQRHYDAHLLLGDSTAEMIVDRVRALAPFDVLFIDANHSEKFVRADFANYGRLASFCCFHDISAGPRKPGRLPIEVPKVWRELKETLHETATFREIRRDETRNDNGIGILQWR